MGETFSKVSPIVPHRPPVIRSSADAYLACENALVILVVLFQQCGRVEPVGAFFAASAAAAAGLYLLHLLLPMLGEPVFGRCAAEHERHSRALIDSYPLRAGHAVAAAAAEIECKLLAVVLYHGAQLIVEHGRLIKIREPFGELVLALYTPISAERPPAQTYRQMRRANS